MINTQIVETIKGLSPSDRLEVVELTCSLLKEDLLEKEERHGAKQSQSFSSLVSEMIDAGKDAMLKGAPELPSDFASEHDKYLYGKDSR